MKYDYAIVYLTEGNQDFDVLTHPDMANVMRNRFILVNAKEELYDNGLRKMLDDTKREKNVLDYRFKEYIHLYLNKHEINVMLFCRFVGYSKAFAKKRTEQLNLKYKRGLSYASLCLKYGHTSVGPNAPEGFCQTASEAEMDTYRRSKRPSKPTAKVIRDEQRIFKDVAKQKKIIISEEEFAQSHEERMDREGINTPRKDNGGTKNKSKKKISQKDIETQYISDVEMSSSNDSNMEDLEAGMHSDIDDEYSQESIRKRSHSESSETTLDEFAVKKTKVDHEHHWKMMKKKGSKIREDLEKYGDRELMLTIGEKVFEVFDLLYELKTAPILKELTRSDENEVMKKIPYKNMDDLCRDLKDSDMRKKLVSFFAHRIKDVEPVPIGAKMPGRGLLQLEQINDTYLPFRQALVIVIRGSKKRTEEEDRFALFRLHLQQRLLIHKPVKSSAKLKPRPRLIMTLDQMIRDFLHEILNEAYAHSRHDNLLRRIPFDELLRRILTIIHRSFKDAAKRKKSDGEKCASSQRNMEESKLPTKGADDSSDNESD